MPQCLRLTAVCLSAVIGAGFASGRELMSFFSQYGPYSWLGIGIAAPAMGWLCYLLLSGRLKGLMDWPVSQGAFTALLLGTAAAMTAAGGELFSLLWPFSAGYPLGMLITLSLALLAAQRGLKTLETAGIVLFPCLLVIFTLAALLPGWKGISSEPLFSWTAPFQGLAYAGLNMTLAAPTLTPLSQDTNEKDRRRTAAVFAIVIFALMGAGNGILLQHPQLQTQPLPMVQLLRSFGKGGFLLCGLGLYLAVFSTLLAALNGLKSTWKSFCTPTAQLIWALATLVLALWGFTPLVNTLYPILGWLCLFLMGFHIMKTHGHCQGFCGIIRKIKFKGATHESQ